MLEHKCLLDGLCPESSRHFLRVIKHTNNIPKVPSGRYTFLLCLQGVMSGAVGSLRTLDSITYQLCWSVVFEPQGSLGLCHFLVC